QDGAQGSPKPEEKTEPVPPPPPPGRPETETEGFPPGEPAPPGEPKKDGSSSARRSAAGGRFTLASFSPAGAEAQGPKKEGTATDIQIEINTPIIKEIRKSLQKRFSKLLTFYEKGAIGESQEGYLETRDESKLSLVEKRDLRALVDGENRDRKNLYQEIVRANKFDDSRLKDVQRIFADQWIERSR